MTEPHIEAHFVIEAVGDAHDLFLFDPAAPLGPQFASADAVIDSGGSVGTREMLDAAQHVRLWQIMGSGFDHFDLAHWRRRGVAVANCPGSASAPALAQRALMFCLMLAQNYEEAPQTCSEESRTARLARNWKASSWDWLDLARAPRHSAACLKCARID